MFEESICLELKVSDIWHTSLTIKYKLSLYSFRYTTCTLRAVRSRTGTGPIKSDLSL
jgi:hypothetical protein